jgi:hypothetical protein
VKTIFQLTLYAGEDEVSLELGKSAFEFTDTTDFISPDNALLPKITVSLSMIIDWQNYVLQTNKSQFHLPTIVKLKPWQLPLLHRVVPKLKALQLTALCDGHQIQSWTLFYLVFAIHRDSINRLFHRVININRSINRLIVAMTFHHFKCR